MPDVLLIPLRDDAEISFEKKKKKLLVDKSVFVLMIKPMTKASIFRLSEETLLQEVNICYQRPLPHCSRQGPANTACLHYV